MEDHQTPSKYSENNIPDYSILSENDQNLQDKINNLQIELKSSSKQITCPYCRKNGNTRIESKCNALTTVFAILGVIVLWAIFQKCRSKDISCKDAEHFCTSCGNKLASYKSI